MKRTGIYSLGMVLAIGLFGAAVESSLYAKTQNAQPTPATPAAAEAIASPSDTPLPIPMALPAGELQVEGSPTVVCEKCVERCIKYRHHLTLRKTCCGCDEPVKTILMVVDPCTCCEVEIPLCLPGCCKDVPKICSHRGILARNVVEYEWCCGYRAKIVFDRRGDVTVHTYGR